MAEKKLPIIDKQGKVIGSASRKECHNNSFLLHPVVHLHVFNQQGELLLQKRSKKKDIQPNKWDTSVGGHVEYGEVVEMSLFREAFEELNLKNFTPKFMQSYIFISEHEREKVYSYTTIYPNRYIIFNKEEIDEVKFWPISEIKHNIGGKLFTPNFEYEFCLLLPYKKF